MTDAVYLHGFGLINALGEDCATVASRLFAGDTGGMVPDGLSVPGRTVMVGPVRRAVSTHAAAQPAPPCRNDALLRSAMAQLSGEFEAALRAFGPARIGVVIGTSTAGIAEGESALASKLKHGQFPPGYDYHRQEMGAPARTLADVLQLTGPAYGVSTACTSSAKAFASARRLIRAGFCDAVIVGGADSLSRLTLNGFAALESTSAELCQPFSVNRRGINIGEAAALTVMSRIPSPWRLAGIGESSDAHHISAPDPEGRGAIRAMRAALADAGLRADQIAYLNLHGTATPQNDAMEARAVAEVFGLSTPASSTKPLTGHTLGAAGATELAFCALTLSAYNPHRRLPPQRFDGQRDPALPPIRLAGDNDRLAVGACYAMSNSFAFGGSNISLILQQL